MLNYYLFPYNQFILEKQNAIGCEYLYTFEVDVLIECKFVRYHNYLHITHKREPVTSAIYFYKRTPINHSELNKFKQNSEQKLGNHDDTPTVFL